MNDKCAKIFVPKKALLFVSFFFFQQSILLQNPVAAILPNMITIRNLLHFFRKKVTKIEIMRNLPKFCV